LRLLLFDYFTLHTIFTAFSTELAKVVVWLVPWCRLGNKWAELSGKEFFYFMVFDKKPVDGAYTIDKAKELIRSSHLSAD
jgi:hypothetical protein